GPRVVCCTVSLVSSSWALPPGSTSVIPPLSRELLPQLPLELIEHSGPPTLIELLIELKEVEESGQVLCAHLPRKALGVAHQREIGSEALREVLNLEPGLAQ